MARKKIAGVSLTQIAKDLNRRGIPTKRRGERLNIGNVKGQCQVKAAFGIWTAGIVLKLPHQQDRPSISVHPRTIMNRRPPPAAGRQTAIPESSNDRASAGQFFLHHPAAGCITEGPVKNNDQKTHTNIFA